MCHITLPLGTWHFPPLHGFIDSKFKHNILITTLVLLNVGHTFSFQSHLFNHIIIDRNCSHRFDLLFVGVCYHVVIVLPCMITTIAFFTLSSSVLLWNTSPYLRLIGWNLTVHRLPSFKADNRFTPNVIRNSSLFSEETRLSFPSIQLNFFITVALTIIG